jgi:thiol:disulfide interchange protein DsbD
MNLLRALFLLLFCCAPAWAQTSPSQVLTVTPSLSRQSAAPGDKIELRLKLKIQPPYHVNSNPASESYLIPVTATVAGAGLKAGAPIYPKGELKKFEFAQKPLSVYEGEIEIRVPITVTGTPRAIAGSVRYQACNDKSCLIPKTVPFEIALQSSGAATSTPHATPTPHFAGANGDSFSVALRNRFAVKGLPQIVFLDGQGRERTDLRAGEELSKQGKEVFLQKLAALKTGETWTQREGAGSWLQRLQNAPLWSQLILVFFGGLLLNLTPCVYPIIPITIGFFGAQTENKASGRFKLAALYVLGLALVYSALGVTAALTGKLFGAALQSPLVPGVLAAVLLLLALSMFGVFTIQPPSFILQKSGAKRGALGALAMGALLGFVAAPCVGPVVVALLTYVGTRANPFLGFVLFFVLSLGLGLPYLLLGMFSGAIKALPKSGAWLERLKKIFAVPLVLAAIYYAFIAFNAFSTTRAASTARHWPDATTQLLENARRVNKPVVLDFRADWCLPCLQLERTIFSKPEVLAAQKDVALLRVDLTRADG